MTSSHPKHMVVNGRFVSFEEATTHLMTAGMRYGLNVFEGLRGYWSERGRSLNIFRLEDHLRRLWLSMKILRFEPQFTAEEISSALLMLVRAVGVRENCIIRISAYIEGFGDHTDRSPVSYFIYLTPGPRAANVDTGIRCGVSSWARVSDLALPPRVKTGASYVNVRLARIQAKHDGYDDAILLNPDGSISEGPGAAVFLVRGEQLVTPSITSGILESITRDTILTLAQDRGINIEQRPIDRTELYTADEVFFAGTAAEIIPIISIDGLAVDRGQVGRVTRDIQGVYFGTVEGRDEKWARWLLPVTDTN